MRPKTAKSIPCKMFVKALCMWYKLHAKSKNLAGRIETDGRHRHQMPCSSEVCWAYIRGDSRTEVRGKPRSKPH